MGGWGGEKVTVWNSILGITARKNQFSNFFLVKILKFKVQKRNFIKCKTNTNHAYTQPLYISITLTLGVSNQL